MTELETIQKIRAQLGKLQYAYPSSRVEFWSITLKASRRDESTAFVASENRRMSCSTLNRKRSKFHNYSTPKHVEFLRNNVCAETRTTFGRRLQVEEKMLNGNYVRKWRDARNLSARELGQALGYRGRDNVAKIEIGLTPVTAKFAKRFNAYKNQTHARELRERKIETRYALPPQIKILARPRKCGVCKEWFIFPNASDRVCTDRKCRRIYREKNL